MHCPWRRYCYTFGHSAVKNCIVVITANSSKPILTKDPSPHVVNREFCVSQPHCSSENNMSRVPEKTIQLFHHLPSKMSGYLLKRLTYLTAACLTWNSKLLIGISIFQQRPALWWQEIGLCPEEIHNHLQVGDRPFHIWRQPE